MSNNRKKELKLEYKEMKHPMGIFIIRSNSELKCFIETAQNLKARMNSAKVKLQGGMHPYLELQKAWKEKGEANFTMEILEYLEYDEDEAKTDYSEELTLLQMIWEEKLTKEHYEFYQKRL
jgi:hypothetical protein